MGTHTSNIDDLLMGGSGDPSTPKAAEHDDVDMDSLTDGVIEVDDTETRGKSKQPDFEPQGGDDQDMDDDSDPEKEQDDTDTDEYGNKQAADNDVIRDRLARQAESMRRRHDAEIAQLKAQLAQSGASQQVQQAASDFQYDPNSDGDWQQQLAQFVKHTVQNMNAEQQRAQHEAETQRQDGEFRARFQQGMDRFDDFVEVVGHQPMTDAMVTATRGMRDPAAFIYAASKRAPQELERISKIKDTYTQVAETIRLEERLKKAKPTTTAPRPLERQKEDTHMPNKSKKNGDGETKIEDLIAQSDAKRLAIVRSRYKR